MDAELITTGTEILLGEIVDTNAAWLAGRLRDLGINLYYKTTVGDNLERLASVMRQALGRSDLVVVTGGLGPTVDDITRDAAALATDRELVLNQQALADIEAIFARWGRQVHDNNRRQALMPAQATPIPNPVGTAPGFIVDVPRSGRPLALLICLPGVPREMKHLMQEAVEPFLVERLGPGRAIIRSRTLRTVGLGESTIDARIGDLMRGRNPTVGLAAHLGQVDVRITARATDLQEADRLIEAVVEELYARLGSAIYGEGQEPLERALVRALRQSDQTLAVAETNTLGEIAQRLRAVPEGAGVLTAAYLLPGDLALPPGGPSLMATQGFADWLANWLQQQPALLSGASLVLAVCGTLDPAAGPYGSQRGETYMTIAGQGWQDQQRIDVGGTDELARRWVGNAVMNRLRLCLQQGSEDMSVTG